jgi:hypothetical protein
VSAPQTRDIHTDDVIISEMPGFSPKAIVIDGRGHMLGRLASIVAKLLLSGNKVNLASVYLVCSCCGVGAQSLNYKYRLWLFSKIHQRLLIEKKSWLL